MDIHISGLHTDLTPIIEEYARKRLDVLSKFTHNQSARCEVELIKITEHHRSGDIFKAEGIIYIGGNEIFAAAEREDLYQAVDALRDELERMLVSRKDKRQTLFRRGAQKVKNIVKRIRPARIS